MTAPSPVTTDYVRNTDLATLAATLNDHRTRTVDVVAPATDLRVENGAFRLSGTETVLTADGVDTGDGLYTPGTVAIEGIAQKLVIPNGYLRRMFDDRRDLFDANVNGWLSDPSNADRSFLVRGLRTGETGGFGRAFLSDRYRAIDNFDVLLATLAGLRASGVDDPVISADLTERRMYVRVQSSGVAVMAPDLLKDYRSPFTGETGADNPLVFAGFAIANSEVGNGRFTITPQITIQICGNGVTFTKDAMARTHLGAALDEGVVAWSAATIRKNLDLVTSQTVDAVSTFLSADYVNAKVEEITRAAGVPIDNAQKVVSDVSSRLGFSEAESASILDMFIKGGQMSAGGVLNAVTAAAQTAPSADGRAAMEARAIDAMYAVPAVLRATR